MNDSLRMAVIDSLEKLHHVLGNLLLVRLPLGDIAEHEAID